MKTKHPLLDSIRDKREQRLFLAQRKVAQKTGTLVFLMWIANARCIEIAQLTNARNRNPYLP